MVFAGRHYDGPVYVVTGDHGKWSGAVTLGMGDKLDKKATGNKTLTAGSYALAPASMNHYAFTGAQETTILLYGVGPVEFKYANPSDDPRNKRSTP